MSFPSRLRSVPFPTPMIANQLQTHKLSQIKANVPEQTDDAFLQHDKRMVRACQRRREKVLQIRPAQFQSHAPFFDGVALVVDGEIFLNVLPLSSTTHTIGCELGRRRQSTEATYPHTAEDLEVCWEGNHRSSQTRTL